MIVAGIDPGKGGALSILYPDGAALIFDVPRMKLRGKDRPAWAQWAREWGMAMKLNPPDFIVIEDVAARHGQGVVSMFTFGRALGFAHGIVATAASVPVHPVTPSVWKGKLGLLKSDKNASREMARSLFPRAAHAFERVKDDGRAEATLLAYYGRKYLTSPQ